MSGSPIIQDDKIIGAVTHVVIDNPTTGYGIFITTMLEEGENSLLFTKKRIIKIHHKTLLKIPLTIYQSFQ